MCPPPGWLRPQPGLLDGSFSVDTEDGRRFFQENRRFPTNRVHSSGSVGCRSGVYRLECTRDLGEVGQVPFPGRT